jgi:DNA-binding MarR family transcriptional regulator
MRNDRLTNRLGALALALADAQIRAAREGAGLGHSSCAALVTLGQHPDETIGALSRVLGLTHSVTVRLVEGLVRDGLVRRLPGADKRQVALRLTPEGEAVWTSIRNARQEVLSAALDAVGPRDRAHLDRIIVAMLARLTTGRREADHICRLCDEVACGGDRCPVERRAVELDGAGR